MSKINDSFDTRRTLQAAMQPSKIRFGTPPPIVDPIVETLPKYTPPALTEGRPVGGYAADANALRAQKARIAASVPQAPAPVAPVRVAAPAQVPVGGYAVEAEALKAQQARIVAVTPAPPAAPRAAYSPPALTEARPGGYAADANALRAQQARITAPAQLKAAGNALAGEAGFAQQVNKNRVPPSQALTVPTPKTVPQVDTRALPRPFSTATAQVTPYGLPAPQDSARPLNAVKPTIPLNQAPSTSLRTIPAPSATGTGMSVIPPTQVPTGGYASEYEALKAQQAKIAAAAPKGTGISAIPDAPTVRPANAAKPTIPLGRGPSTGMSVIPAAPPVPDAAYAAEVRKNMDRIAATKAKLAGGTPGGGTPGGGTPGGGTPGGGTPGGGTPGGGTPGGGTPAGKPAGIVQRAFNATKEGTMKYGGKTLNAGKGALGFAGKVLTPFAFAQGAAQSYGDTQNGYKENFDASLGGEKDGYGDRLAGTLANFLPGDKELFSDLGTNTLRTMGNVGDALTGGYASKFGSGISSSLAGRDFSEGFDNTPRDRFNALRNAPAVTDTAAAAAASASTAYPPADAWGPHPQAANPSVATPVVPGEYQSKRLAQMGIPVSDQNKTPVDTEARFSSLRDGTGTSGGILQSKTSEPGVTNLGSYGGDSNIYATASKPGGRLDTFTGVGAHSRGDSSAPVSEQEKARDAIAKLAAKGDNPDAIRAYTTMRVADANARAESARAGVVAANASRDGLREVEKEGNKNYNDIVKGQEDLNSFAANTNLQQALGLGEDLDGDKIPDSASELSRLPPDEMRTAVARLRSMMELQNNARSAGAVNSIGFTPPVGDEFNPEFWRDAVTGDMNRWDYMLQAIGVDSDKAQRLENGKVVSMDRYIGEDGNAGTLKSALEDYKARNRLRESRAKAEALEKK